MSIYNSIEKVISAEILRSNEDNLIANRICNTSFVGDIKNRGDSVTFIGLSEPTVYNYEGTLDYEDISDSGVVLSIDQDMVFSFMVKDLEELRSSIGLKDSQTKRASYNLGLAVDKYVLYLYDKPLETLSDVAVNQSNVMETIAAAKQALEEENVPDGQSWIVVPPFVKTKLMLAGIKFQINNGVNGTGSMGFTDELGFDIYVSNNLAQSSGNTMMLCGSYSAIAYAEQVLETQVIDRMESSFATAVRGRLVFGAKVIKPKELICTPVSDGGNTISA